MYVRPQDIMLTHVYYVEHPNTKGETKHITESTNRRKKKTSTLHHGSADGLEITSDGI